MWDYACVVCNAIDSVELFLCCVQCKGQELMMFVLFEVAREERWRFRHWEFGYSVCVVYNPMRREMEVWA